MIATQPAKPRNSTKRRKWSILGRDSFRCAYCGKDLLASLDDLISAGIDHVTPRSAGGTSDPANIVASCMTCNVLKSSTRIGSVEEGRQLVVELRERYVREWRPNALRWGVDLAAIPRGRRPWWRRLADVVRRWPR